MRFRKSLAVFITLSFLLFSCHGRTVVILARALCAPRIDANANASTLGKVSHLRCNHVEGRFGIGIKIPRKVESNSEAR
jgi:hypothetical protein